MYATPKFGEQCVYHVGLLMWDRQGYEPQAVAAHRAGNLAWRDYQAGTVSLVQRIVGVTDQGDNIYHYIACGRQSPQARRNALNVFHRSLMAT